MNIGIVIIATNAYFILGIRLMKKFMRHYKGDKNIKFYFFSDTDPKPYLPDHIDVQYIPESHTNWQDGTNSKFRNILSLQDCSSDYLFYFDADTNVNQDFTEEWFIGDLVGGEHYGNASFLKDGAGFDRNPQSRAYVPMDSTLPYTYYYGAFFGGKKDRVMDFCRVLKSNQDLDKAVGYEPPVNDESYINQYFHFNPPVRTVPSAEFKFLVSDKGGLGDTRYTNMDISEKRRQILELKEKHFELMNNQLVEI
jgi:hypothetical protein